MAETVELEWIPADGSGLSRRAKQGGKYYAFVPDPLAGMSLKLPSELSRRIVRIEREIHNLGMRDNTHSLEGVARLLLRSEAVASSRIEGIAPNSDKVAMAILARESDAEIRGSKNPQQLSPAMSPSSTPSMQTWLTKTSWSWMTLLQCRQRSLQKSLCKEYVLLKTGLVGLTITPSMRLLSPASCTSPRTPRRSH